MRINKKTGEWMYLMRDKDIEKYCIVGIAGKYDSSRRVKFSSVEDRYFKLSAMTFDSHREILLSNYKEICGLAFSLRYFKEKRDLEFVCESLHKIYVNCHRIKIRKYSDEIQECFRKRGIDDLMYLYQVERFEDGLDYECVGICNNDKTKLVVKNSFDDDVVVPIENCEYLD